MPEPIRLFQPTVVLTDGTIFKGDCGISSNDELWVWVTTDMPLISVAVVFSDPTKTNVIHYNRSEYFSEDYEGYTKLTTINYDKRGRISIRLEK